MVAVSFYGKLDWLCLNEVREKKFFHSVQIVLAGIKAQD